MNDSVGSGRVGRADRVSQSSTDGMDLDLDLDLFQRKARDTHVVVIHYTLNWIMNNSFVGRTRHELR